MNLMKYLCKMKLTNVISLVLLLLVAIPSVSAQRQDRERIKSLKVAFITERLDLSSEQAQVFWPVYNDFDKQMNEYRREERSKFKNEKLTQDITDSEANVLLDEYFALKNKKIELHEAYIAKMRKLLSPQQTLLLLHSERDFNRKLLRQVGRKGKR